MEDQIHWLIISVFLLSVGQIAHIVSHILEGRK